MNVLGPSDAILEVLVYREGLLSAVGHDLVLRATAFRIEIDPAAPAVAARVDAASLRVAGALRDRRPLEGVLSPANVREIEATTARSVLQAARFPEIRFASSEVVRGAAGYRIRGTLALLGTSRPVEVSARRDGDRLVAEMRLRQPAFGIRPHTAMLGALRVKAEVLVRASLTASAAERTAS